MEPKMVRTDDFDLDDFLAFAEASIKFRGDNDPRYCLSDPEKMMKLLCRHGARVFRVYRQWGGTWVVEVNYRGITYIHATLISESLEELIALSKPLSLN